MLLGDSSSIPITHISCAYMSYGSYTLQLRNLLSAQKLEKN